MKTQTNTATPVAKSKKGFMFYLKRDWELYALVAIPLIFIVVFKFLPLLGLSIAFMDYNPILGFSGSKFVGFDVFRQMFTSPDFYVALRNTIVLNLFDLVCGFPMPIILAIFLNEITCTWYKKLTQTILYLPHFLSWVIISAIAYQLFSPSTGIVNIIIGTITGTGESALIPFLTEKWHWAVMYILLAVWQSMGWGTIIYLAAITGINGDLYEAADIDGAGRFGKIWHVTLPGIKPTIVVMLIMALGRLMGSNFERVQALSNTNVTDFSEVIATYVYRVGLGANKFNISTAVGLFQSVVGLVLVLLSDRVAKALGEGGLV
ncbi:MAG: sugar ABC transporter permease [Clostridia bacterium]|nr:sugar ABC transporter permease [Clostridia bacterium]